MGQKNINLGSGYDTLDGDKLRDGGRKINDNFSELYVRAQAWVSGLYPANTIVLYQNKAYLLNNSVTLPYNSTDFVAERTAGDWIVIEGSNIFLVSIHKHPSNLDDGSLEINDAVTRYFDNGGTIEFWKFAIYLGGDSETRGSYNIVDYTEI